MRNNYDSTSGPEPRSCDLSSKHFADGFERCSIYQIAALYSPLSESEEKELLRQKGTSTWKEAKEQLILRNLRLVMWLANQSCYAQCNGFAPEDLIEYGIIGLMLGIERYDQHQDTKLSTYVVPWIKKVINEQVMFKQGLITVPNHMRDIVSKLYQERHRMITENIIEPSMAELLKRVNADPSKAASVATAANALFCKSLDAPLSADTKNASDNGATVGDFIQDGRDVAEQAVDSALAAAILEYMKQLPEFEQKVVRYRFGIDDGQPRTFMECGEHFGCTTECCRQAYHRAITKIQSVFVEEQAS